jgi:lipoprotein-releasing system ATP-binding protein
MSDKERSEVRNRILGFVFQYLYLLPDFTDIENVIMTLLIAKNVRKKQKKFLKTS